MELLTLVRKTDNNKEKEIGKLIQAAYHYIRRLAHTIGQPRH